MNLNRRHFLRAAGVGALGAAVPGLLGETRSASAAPAAPAASPLPAAAKSASRPPLLDKALAALDTHGGRIAQRDIVGLVDFSAHSSKRRFQLVDVASGEIAATYLVAHGRGSDPGHTGYVKEFSNVPGSNASSRGAYLVSNTYYGKYGRSRRLVGLGPDNDLALDRAIVLHGASYVSPHLVDVQGRIGRSLGCFSVAEGRIQEVLDRLGEGRLLYADRA
jgi:hypothetical protein